MADKKNYGCVRGLHRTKGLHIVDEFAKGGRREVWLLMTGPKLGFGRDVHDEGTKAGLFLG